MVATEEYGVVEARVIPVKDGAARVAGSTAREVTSARQYVTNGGATGVTRLDMLRQCARIEKNITVCEKSTTKIKVKRTNNFLFRHHASPGGDGVSPADKVFSFQIRTLFLQLPRKMIKSTSALISSVPKPNEADGSCSKELCMKNKNVEVKNKVKVNKSFEVDDCVFVYWPHSDTKYVKGKVIKKG